MSASCTNRPGTHVRRSWRIKQRSAGGKRTANSPSASPRASAPSPGPNGIASPARRAAIRAGYNPFLSYDFLTSLEESGCAVPRTGWQGQHLGWKTAKARLLGAVPCYPKSHSQGEYVFDHGWADAFERAGGSYYPKLQASVPFTPVTGPRLLVAEGADEAVTQGRACGRAEGRDRAARRFLGACHLRDRGRCRHPRGGRLPAPHRPAVPFLQRGLWQLRRFPRHARLAQAQGAEEGAARGAGRRHQHRLADRQATSPRAPGTRSSPSTWTPAAANGAGPISTANSSR